MCCAVIGFLLDQFFPLAVRNGWTKAPPSMAHASQRDMWTRVRKREASYHSVFSLAMPETGSGVVRSGLTVPIEHPSLGPYGL